MKILLSVLINNGKVKFLKFSKKAIVVIILLLIQTTIGLANENTNSRPISQIFFEKLQDNYLLDTYIVLDESLDNTIAESIKSKENSLNNDIKLIGVDSKTQIWDLRDRQISKTETDTKNTGKNYPPSSIQYSSGGYAGSLDRIDVENDSYKVDNGEYVTTTESKTVNDTLTSYAYTYYDQSGNVIGSNSPGNPTISYNQDGFEGTLTKYNVILVDTSYQYYPNGVIRVRIKKYLGYYTGVVTKTTTEWVSDWHTVNDYTGYYEGEVTKVVKEEFSDSFRSNSDKYIVFVSGSEFRSVEELGMFKEMTDGDFYLIGPNEAEGLNYLGTSNFKNGWDNFLDILKNKYTKEDKNIVLINEQFKLVKEVTDEENDPISIWQKQLVHDPNLYENNSGYIEGGNKTFSVDNYISGQFENELSFNKKGLFSLYQRVKDSPEENPNLGLYSNDAKVDIYVHERPIAKCKIYWQYDDNAKMYDLEFIDLSYDPDYQFAREDKGIVDKKITYNFNNKQHYNFPEKLPPGDYTFHYSVKDCYNAWSEQYEIKLSLDEDPKYLGKYEIYYQLEGQTIYQETIEKVLPYSKTDTMTVYAKDFLPAYSLVSNNSISAKVTKESPISKVYFHYEKVKPNPSISLVIESDKMRNDGTIASGYGFELFLNTQDLNTDGVVVYAEWLEEKDYEWVYGQNYTIDNKYYLEEFQLGQFLLEKNEDSISNARKIFIPVELSDGVYSGVVNIGNIKEPNYYINDHGELVFRDYTFKSIEKPFSVNVRGTMYEDLNIVN